MNLNETAKTALENSLKRQHNGANIRVADILKHCAGEVVEAEADFILWKYEAHAPETYAEELADIIICALIAAARDRIDIEKAINDKMEKNAKRAEMQGDKL